LEERVHRGKFQFGARIGYGVYVGDGPEGAGDVNVDPYGIGFGAFFGYTLDMNVYLGAGLEYYFGFSEEGPGMEISGNVWNLMFEPGYDIAAGETLVIRPQLGLGLTTARGASCSTLPVLGEECLDTFESEFAIASGAMLLIDFGGLYAQAGLRYQHVFVEDGNADGLLINAGIGATF
jgi:hypothetical protein